jgi:hypothetical protein
MRKFASYLIVSLAVPALFNVLFFLSVDRETVNCAWVCYIFFHVAFLCLVLPAIFQVYRFKQGILNTTLLSISAVYFLVELLTSIVFLTTYPDEKGTSLLIQILELGIFVAVFFMNSSANFYTESSMERHVENSHLMREAISKAKLLQAKSQADTNNKKITSTLLDNLRSCPIEGNSSTESIEKEIIAILDELSIQIENGTIDNSKIESIDLRINERNILLKDIKF